MPVEASSDASPQLALDHSAFEKLLEAAWVLQCLHDQLHYRDVDGAPTSAQPRKLAEIDDSRLNVAIKPAVHPPSRVTGAESVVEMSRGGPIFHEACPEPVKTQQQVLTGISAVVAPKKIELASVLPKSSLRSRDVAAVRAPKPPVFETRANDNKRKWQGLAANLRSAFYRMLKASTNLRPALRVHLPWRAVRATGIAIPIFLLTVVAGLLLFETWRHVPVHSAQAISIPNSAGDRVVGPSPTLTVANPAASESAVNRKPGRAATITFAQSSHRQVTDPAASSVLRGLSRFEITGLRRRAKYGDNTAAFDLGMAYEVGRHVPRSCTEATHWVMTAAEAGNAAAQYNLGLRYRDGDGVPSNRAESRKWLRKAAARRYPSANAALQLLASR